jgi:cardiolipin synthase
LPRHDLLIGAAEFWARASADIASARRRVLVQAMTFEGDAAGLEVAAALRASAAPLRRVAVDDYTRWVVNDRWVHTRSARRDEALQAEVRATTAMFADLEGAGVEVVWTEPVRRLWRDYPFRNHRKMIVVDDAAYIGGINFSDHNFGWTDLMVRIAREDAADRLATDFPSAGATAARAWRGAFGDLTLYALDGRRNGEAFASLMSRLDQAREEIVVISPYLTFPFTGALVRARRRGVRVSVVTPRVNNKPLLHRYIAALARREGFRLVQTPHMSHVKAVVVDGAAVILGSSNFDFVSHEAEAEIIALFENRDMAAELHSRLIAPALASDTGQTGEVSFVSGAIATAALRLAQQYVRVLKLARGGV